MKKCIVSIVIIVGVMLLLLCINTNNENFTAYSGFRATGRKDKNMCNNYYLKQYSECVKNSGGVDVQGNCLNRIKPYLISCNFTDF